MNPTILNKPNLPIKAEDIHANFRQKGGEQIIRIVHIENNLPYSCIVEIDFDENADFDRIYYAALGRNNLRLFYKSDVKRKTIQHFSIQDFSEMSDIIQLYVWPVKGEGVNRIIYDPTISKDWLNANRITQVGGYPFELEGMENISRYYERIIENIRTIYGDAALPGKVKITDGNYDIFFPSINTIQLAENPKNTVHELVHAHGKQLLFATKGGHYNETTELLEEFFTEGVANEVHNKLQKLFNPNSSVVFGSILGYNYDFRIEEISLGTQNLQSSQGGIQFLETARYYMLSAAFEKVSIAYSLHAPYPRHFAKEFRKLFHKHIMETKQTDSSRELFGKIVSDVFTESNPEIITDIEGLPAEQWFLNQGNLFTCEIVEGPKIYMDFRDYLTGSEWIGIARFWLYDTFENGSDWAYGDKRYSRNGQTILISIRDHKGNNVHSQKYIIPNFENGFGYVKIYFKYTKQSEAIKHFNKQDQESGIESHIIDLKSNNGGLYSISVQTMTENVIDWKVIKRYYRIMGRLMFDKKDHFIFANPSKKIKALHYQHWERVGNESEQGKVSWHYFEDGICVVKNPFIKGRNTIPGELDIYYLEQKEMAAKETTDYKLEEKATYRNIGYGNDFGGQQFLLK